MSPDVERILRACVAQRDREIDRLPGQTELLCLEIKRLRADLEVAESRKSDVIKAMKKAMYEARGHLGAIMIQTQPQDDPIIIGHVADALRILGGSAP